MIGDLNWLYSTIAQSSAAIVAIIGGFITATMLMLTSERRGLKNQLSEKKTRLEVLKSQERELFEGYESIRVDTFLDGVILNLTEGEDLPSLEVILKQNPDWNLDRKILEREYKKITKRRLEARQFIEAHSEKISTSDYFEEWFKNNNFDISSYDYNLLREEFNKFVAKQREKQKQKMEGSTFRLFQGISGPEIPNIVMPYNLPNIYESQKQDRRLEDVGWRLTGLRYEISLLENEVNNIRSRLNTFSYPPNLKWGIAVLAYLGVGGILFPVITIKNAAYSASNREIAIGLFASGLGAIFAYIVFLIRTLRKSRKE